MHHRGIFPTIARINHACDASACYRWNSTLNQLTVHANRDISQGEEITVCYSFDGLLREERQRHLFETFGFQCACDKCSLTGKELEESERRLAKIGNVSSCVNELVRFSGKGEGEASSHYLKSIHKTSPNEFLDRLDEKWFLLRDEFPPEGRADGVEHFLQAFVELCERAVGKLNKLASNAEEGAELLKEKAGAYADAAHDWACLSRDLTRDQKGEDSPAYQLWARALDVDGVWSLEEGGGFEFYKRWIEAGLGRHAYCYRELA